MRVPDLVSPIEGWRVWVGQADAGDVWLESLYFRLRWPRRTPARASCNSGVPHEVPGADCRCGIYAAKTLEQALRYVRARSRQLEPNSLGLGVYMIVGKVHLWGEVEEHEIAYRAEFAYPSALFVPRAFRSRRGRAGADEACVLLWAGYDVPATVVPSLERLGVFSLTAGKP